MTLSTSRSTITPSTPTSLPRVRFADGISQLVWAYERQADIIARTLGIDPIEFRRRNAIRTDSRLPRERPCQAWRSTPCSIGWPSAWPGTSRSTAAPARSAVGAG